MMLEKPYREYVLQNDIKFLEHFDKDHKCSLICQLKQKHIFPKLFKLGSKIRTKHMLCDIMIDIQGRDGKTGKVKDCKHFHGQSWVRQFGDCLYACHMPRAANRSITAIGNTTVTIDINDLTTTPSNQSGLFAVFAQFADGLGHTNTGWGIQMGSGTAAVDISDFELESQIITNMDHGIMQLEEALNAPDSTTRQFKFIRHFTNLTGATVNVNEIGLVGRMSYDSLLHQNFLLERSVLPATFSFDNNDVAIVGYTVKLLG